jgi:hypothetical protein
VDRGRVAGLGLAGSPTAHREAEGLWVKSVAGAGAAGLPGRVSSLGSWACELPRAFLPQ